MVGLAGVMCSRVDIGFMADCPPVIEGCALQEHKFARQFLCLLRFEDVVLQGRLDGLQQFGAT